MKSILHKSFRYVPAAKTDIRKTFNRLFPGWNRKPTPPVPVIELKKRRAA